MFINDFVQVRSTKETCLPQTCLLRQENLSKGYEEGDRRTDQTVIVHISKD